jgi:hypothetical protein
MPDYSTPEDWTTEELVLASKLNRHIRDNMQWFKSPPFNSVINSAIINTTSTSVVEVTGTSTTVTSTGGNMLIVVSGINDNGTSGNTNTWDIAVDGTRLGHATTGLTAMRATGVQYADCVNMQIITPVSAGLHTYSAYWKVSAGTGSAFVRLFAIEIGGGSVTSWTTPKTWVENEFVDAAELNTHIRDQQLYLRARPFNSASVTAVTTTSTSFIELTGTSVSVTGTGGNFLIIANGTSSNSGVNNSFYDLAIDGARQGDATNGLAFIATNTANYTDSMGIVFFTTTPPSAGAHSYSLHAKVSAGTVSFTGRIYAIELR